MVEEVRRGVTLITRNIDVMAQGNSSTLNDYKLYGRDWRLTSVLPRFVPMKIPSRKDWLQGPTMRGRASKLDRCLSMWQCLVVYLIFLVGFAPVTVSYRSGEDWDSLACKKHCFHEYFNQLSFCIVEDYLCSLFSIITELPFSGITSQHGLTIVFIIINISINMIICYHYYYLCYC